MRPLTRKMLNRLHYLATETSAGWPVHDFRDSTVRGLERRGLVKTRRTITILSDPDDVLADAVPCTVLEPTERGWELVRTGVVREQG